MSNFPPYFAVCLKPPLEQDGDWLTVWYWAPYSSCAVGKMLMNSYFNWKKKKKQFLAVVHVVWGGGTLIAEYGEYTLF